MSAHNIYESYVNKLTTTGCINVIPVSVATLVNQTNISIEKSNPQMCSVFEDIIYTIILHHCVINNDMIGQIPKYIKVMMGNSRKIEINFEDMPQSLLQILYTIIMDIRKM